MLDGSLKLELKENLANKYNVPNDYLDALVKNLKQFINTEIQITNNLKGKNFEKQLVITFKFPK